MDEQQGPEEPSHITLCLPPIFAINETHDGNTIQQLILPERSVKGTIAGCSVGRVKGSVFKPFDESDPPILIIGGRVPPRDGFERVLALRRVRRAGAIGASAYRWVRHPSLTEVPHRPIDYPRRTREVTQSWNGAFSLVEEDSGRRIQGLRLPQIGAVHAVLAHWATTNQAATIVMPTGTGKTDTMLSILVSTRCERLLVVVPTDALRTQIADKFLTLGVLRQFGLVPETALYPIVGVLRHKPKTVDEVDSVFRRCNVIVTTAQIAGQCAEDVQERMAQLCPYLFIDEAHHVSASTWHEFRRKFDGGAILQFTATPFRNDGKHVGGRIIFNYPLRKALEEEYFKRIHFEPVIEFDRRSADLAIAEKAVSQLRTDIQQYDHILMARVESIERAKEVYSIYEQYREFNPVQLHTGIRSKREREQIRRMILNRETRIVICVDMLGEGFDLPELKIAAFHDIKKSLPITLQLAGRFTRAKPQLGNPTFIANIGDVEVQDELRRLYTQDADWNALLMRSSEEVIEEQVALWDFIEGFCNFPEEIPLQNVRPAMSTVVYRTQCEEWTPENFRKGIPGHESLERMHYGINHQRNTLVIVTARKVPIDWIQMRDIYNWDWELFVLHWDSDQHLLFINCSSNSGYYQQLAEAVAGNVELIKGPPIFRCFAGVNRLRLQNVGLVEQLGRLIRYIMRVGIDVEAGLTEAQKRNAVKSNIFGYGYEDGRKTSIGCSYKGRVWSRRVTNIEALTRWCRLIGSKLLDEEIDPDEVLRGTLAPVPVSERPRKMPISIDWPDVMYQEPETACEFILDGDVHLPLYLAELQLSEPAEQGDIAFILHSEGKDVPLTLALFERNGTKDYRFSVSTARTPTIRIGAYRESLEAFFHQNPPVVWFADGSSLEGNLLTELKRKYPPYSAERIRVWDWAGVNIRKESQGATRETDSIQYHVIQELKKADYAIIFDDDGSGEAADVVGIGVEEKLIRVDLLHCKFSRKDTPGARTQDLYEVCGQAQKCVHWMDNPRWLFQHLLRRAGRRKGLGASRFERGNEAELMRIAEMSRYRPIDLSVSIVQPGLSKQRVSQEQLELLSVTENYLMETYKLPFSVIASA